MAFQRWFPVPVFTEIQPASTRCVSLQVSNRKAVPDTEAAIRGH